MNSRTSFASMADSRIIVAIPARNEAERLARCLGAFATQRQKPDTVVLLLNNCTDDSEQVARRMAPHLGTQLLIETRSLPPPIATAGEARRLAVTIAAEWAGPRGIILTTDADAVVPTDWVERNAAALHTADIVCGRVTLDAAESALIPPHLHADDALECELLGLLDEIACVVDPVPADPWPRHTEEAGASLGMTTSALRRAGGMPACASGEDRALVHAMRLIDARIRHDPDIVVTVSGRLEGRAVGGMADTIRRRMVRQDTYTDEQVEPARHAWRRATLRARFRAVWSGMQDAGTLAIDLALPSEMLAQAPETGCFGSLWDGIQRASPVLRRQRVRFKDLPAEIAAARRLLVRYDPIVRAAAE